MTRYYELKDDVRIPKRWHLGEVVSPAGDEPRLRAGIPLPVGCRPLRLDLTQIGKPLDYCLTSFAVPIGRTSLAQAIASVASGDLQRIPVEIPGHEGFEVLNAIRVLKCLDEGRSEFVKWTEKDHRADLAGQYRMVTTLKLLAGEVPRNAHFFRVEGWLIALVVSEDVKEAMERIGCLGAKFVEVT
jgi:hypothetical protein